MVLYLEEHGLLESGEELNSKHDVINFNISTISLNIKKYI